MKTYSMFKNIVWSFLIFLAGCNPPTREIIPETIYKPILMKRADFENAIKVVGPKELSNPKKIYIYKNYLFINANNRGVHIYDNSDPKFPKNVAYLIIQGNEDIAIKNNILYADNGTDLITIDLSDPMSPKVANRIRNAFKEKAPPDFGRIPIIFTKNNRPKETIIVGWEK